MRKSFRYRFYPTTDQAQELARTFGCVRYVYNWGLQLRSEAWTQRKESVNYAETDRRLTILKHQEETAWLSEVSSVPLQQSLRHLNVAFVNFFTHRGRYPKFKSKWGKQSATYTKSGFTFRDGDIKLAKMTDSLDIRWSRPLDEGAEVTSVTVSRDAAGRHHISIACEVPQPPPKPPTSNEVGIDLGISAFATLSTGEKIKNPRPFDGSRRKLAKRQKALARKTKGSGRYRKQKKTVARVHTRIADQRKDFLHQISTRLLNENQVVVIEDLNVEGMKRNRSLSRQISDVGWGEFRRQLEYKADWYDRDIHAVFRWYPSSKTCSSCGLIMKKLPLDVRFWTCPQCDVAHDRDVNAALNILAVGQAERLNARGGIVRPKTDNLSEADPGETRIPTFQGGE